MTMTRNFDALEWRILRGLVTPDGQSRGPLPFAKFRSYSRALKDELVLEFLIGLGLIRVVVSPGERGPRRDENARWEITDKGLVSAHTGEYEYEFKKPEPVAPAKPKAKARAK